MPPSPLQRKRSIDGDISPPSKRRNTAAANFFTPISQKEPDKVAFHTVQHSLLISRFENAHLITRPSPVKVAAFDLDDTLITTKSGNKFATGHNDWRWWHASIPARLRQLDAEGYVIVIISNQAGVSLRSDSKAPKDGMRSLNNLKGKIRTVLNSLDLPVTVYAATEHDRFRKPRGGMWEQLVHDYRLNDPTAINIDHEHCIFVGDAAGREEDKATGRRKDHACSDRDFAANVGIPFSTPEEFFLGEAPKPFRRNFDPSPYLDDALTSDPESTPAVVPKKHGKEIVLFCGSPGGGKSSFYWRHMQSQGYERVNQDLLKSREKCMKNAVHFIEDGKSVVVDNTNADIETRAAWISLARKLKTPIRLVHFTAPAKLCEHNDTVRALAGDLMNPEKRTMLPKAAFSGFASRYGEPRVEEGFEDITRVDFKFQGTEEQKAQWRKFWVS